MFNPLIFLAALALAGQALAFDYRTEREQIIQGMVAIQKHGGGADRSGATQRNHRFAV